MNDYVTEGKSTRNFPAPPSTEIVCFLDLATKQALQIEASKKLDTELWETILFKLKASSKPTSEKCFLLSQNHLTYQFRSIYAL